MVQDQHRGSLFLTCSWVCSASTGKVKSRESDLSADSMVSCVERFVGAAGRGNCWSDWKSEVVVSLGSVEIKGSILDGDVTEGGGGRWKRE